MDVPQEVWSLLGALALSAPLTARAFVRAIDARSNAKRSEADAKKLSAEAEKIEAQTEAETLADLRQRLDSCEARHRESDKRIAQQGEEIGHLRIQTDRDRELLEKFHEKMLRDEKIIKMMRNEIDELNRIIKSGGVHA